MDFELSEELKMVQSLAREFVESRLKPLERDVLGRAADMGDARAYLPAEKEAELVKAVKEMGLWGVGVPEELGGAGLDTLGVCLVEEELATTVVPFHFGDVSPLLFDCNENQRGKFLSPALEGSKRSYLALMEPESGADLSGIRTTAEKSDGSYVINGKKLSLSRTGEDFFALVFAATGCKGVSCFLVEKDTPGLTVSGAEETVGWTSPLHEPVLLEFKDCRVPAGNLLGGEGGAFQLGKKWLPGRRVVRGARCVGAARRLLEEATVRAQTTETFGQLVQERASIKAALADIAMNVHAARLSVYEAAWKADSGRDVRRESAMVKLYTSQVLNTVADRVAHVFNGPPYLEGLPIERLCRRALAASAAEMALDVQRGVVARDILAGQKV
jgi:acyl-CoA dehydrogenase